MRFIVQPAHPRCTFLSSAEVSSSWPPSRHQAKFPHATRELGRGLLAAQVDPAGVPSQLPPGLEHGNLGRGRVPDPGGGGPGPPDPADGVRRHLERGPLLVVKLQ